jgi:WD40 repeat protein
MVQNIFNDSQCTIININPSKKQENTHQENHATQTIVNKKADMECQSVSTNTAMIQTDAEKRVNGDLKIQVDYSSLQSFLNSTESIMSSQLIENVKSQAFQGYSVDWEEQVKDISLSYTLSSENVPEGFESSCIGWNSTGTTIASSFARTDHSSWCSHKGIICAWSLSFRDFKPEKPSFVAETSSCVLCIAFHPKIPSIVAGGMFNGEIVIWRVLDNQDPIVAASVMSEVSHQEPISQLIWAPTEIEDNYQLVSVGSDGKILVWDLSNNLSHPIRMSLIGTKSIPRLLKIQLGTAALGIKCISWPKFHSSDYILGTETGYVLRCNSQAAVNIKADMTTPTSLSNVVTFSYAPHVGPVECISFSPFHRNLFLTCSNDGTVHLYHILSYSPILTWEPCNSVIVSVQWSFERPAVFTCFGDNGTVFVYDLTVRTH